MRDVIFDALSELNLNAEHEEILSRKDDFPLPQRDRIHYFIKELRKIIFPGFFDDDRNDFSAGYRLTELHKLLSGQLKLALALDKNGTEKEAERICDAFFERIPYIQRMMLKDVQATFDGDPAAHSKEEIIFCYPGIFAVYVYRAAHELYKMNVPLIPRIMTEYAHSGTGIDINAGAVIGEYFCIDHGTGIVIGETCEIGNHVKLYQGVTLGALSTRAGQQLSGKKRHPTICDNVTIYSNASILGGGTVIGEGATIGGNTFITESVEKNAKVTR